MRLEGVELYMNQKLATTDRRILIGDCNVCGRLERLYQDNLCKECLIEIFAVLRKDINKINKLRELV